MIKHSILIFIAFLIFINFNGAAQENPVFQDILGKLITYSTKQSPEKTYIQTDKDYYITGETIWYKIFLLDGTTHTPSQKSNVVYAELLNTSDSVIVHQKFYKQGFGVAGHIDIPETMKKGIYTLRAYTKYMINEEQPIFHTKEITIKVPEETEPSFSDLESQKASREKSTEIQGKPLISFYPEGGNLVSGILSVIGVKTNDNEGNGIALKGKIVDEHNHTVSTFETYKYGLGKVTFTPYTDKSYYAIILINGVETKYSLPVPIEKGYALGIRNERTFLILKAATNLKNGLQGSMLIGHIRGRTFFKRIEKSQNNEYSIKLTTKDLEDGVAHFTLFTAKGEPVCERLVFIDNPENDIFLSVKPNSKNYTSRQKASVSLALNDKKDRPLNGNFTASVITNTNNIEDTGSSIKSWLLLNSDIGGTISDVDYFFEKKTPERKYILDALMLTHGWRRFVWKDMLGKKVNKELVFQPEDGYRIEGRVTSFNNKYQPKKATVSLSIFEKGFFNEAKTTDSQGNFSFGPFFFQDTIAGIIEAKPLKPSGKSKDDQLSVYLNAPLSKLLLKNKNKSNVKTIDFKFPEKYLEQAYRRKIEGFKYDPKVIQLNEVTVKEKRKKTRKEIINEKLNEITIFGEPDKRLIVDSIGGQYSRSILDLLIGKVPPGRINIPRPNFFDLSDGVAQAQAARAAANTGTGGADGQTNSGFSTGGSPLFLLDNVPVDNTTISNLNPQNIEFIDIFIGPRAAFYGSRGSRGVVALYTRGQVYIEPEKQKRSPGITNFKINGFSKVREFFSPNYDVPKPEHERADYRTTLHWQPNITIDSDGKSNFTFFTGDVSGTYLIKVEGITWDGRPISTMQSFEVKDFY